MNRPFSGLVAALLRRNSLLVAGLALVLVAPGVSAANLPDWMQALTRESLPTYPPDTRGVALLDDEVTTIKENGETFTVRRLAAKILRNEGKDLADFAVHFSNETKITWMKAWSVDAKGTVYGGNLLLFDPTDEYTPVGFLPPHLQASYALLVRESGIIKLH